MQLKQLTANFAALNKQIQEARAQMQAASRSLIDAAAQEMFSVAPEIERVFWAQYTPYFNDGESCTFSRNDVYFVLEGDEDDSRDWSYLYTPEDYEKALERLKIVQEYEADPAAWFEKIKRERNLPSNARASWYVPYPSSVMQAMSDIQDIEEQRNRIKQTDAERINQSFEAFASALALIPNEIIEVVYGDHVRVSITKNGTSVDSYHHE